MKTFQAKLQLIRINKIDTNSISSSSLFWWVLIGFSKIVIALFKLMLFSWKLKIGFFYNLKWFNKIDLIFKLSTKKMSKNMIKNTNCYRTINANTCSSSSPFRLLGISLINETLIYKYIVYTRYFITASNFCLKKIFYCDLH